MSWKKYLLIVAGVVVIVLFWTGVFYLFSKNAESEKPTTLEPSPYKSALTEGQIDSLVHLLDTYGSQKEIVDGVEALLRERK